MQIKTYQSQADYSWLAHMNLGGDIYMSFFGPTEAEAVQKANSWYAKESERQKRIVGTSEIEIAADSSKSHHFSGKVWVINRQTHDLRRIEPNELAQYEANGYVRGGPRSK